jgi:inner membrane protein
MPSPIAHSVTGHVIYRFLCPGNTRSTVGFRGLQASLYAVIIANFADIDFIPQLLTDGRFHRGPTHSLWFAVIFSALVGIGVNRISKRPFKPCLFYTLMLYSSHLLLDFFTAGGKGMQLLWPFTDALYQSPISFFPAVPHSQGLFYTGHFVFIIFELIYTAFLLIGLWVIWRNRTRKCEETETL